MVAMRRRQFVTFLGGAAAWPLAARAQQPAGRTRKMPLVGVLMPGPAAHSAATLDPFYRGLHELGYIEGQSLAIARRDGDWKTDRLPALAAELAGLKVDLIVAWSTPPARAAKQATNSIPIVAAVMADPVGDELVASLGRPGGNVTGTTFLGPELVARRLQLLRDVVPGLARVAALWHPRAYGEQTMASLVKDIEDAGRTLGMQTATRAGRRSRRYRKRILRDGERARGRFHRIAKPDVVRRAPAHRGTRSEQPTARDVSSTGVR
jgi:putative ABC transport system substrate-binding protein